MVLQLERTPEMELLFSDYQEAIFIGFSWGDEVDVFIKPDNDDHFNKHRVLNTLRTLITRLEKRL